MDAVSRKPPSKDVDENDLEIYEARRTTRPDPPRWRSAMKRAVEQMGVRADGADAAQAQPGRRLRLPGLRLARSVARAPAHRRVLRERRQGGHRGGDAAHGRPRVLRRAPDRRARRAGPTTGSASRAGSPSRWCCARAASHYEPISWDDAFAMIARHLNALGSPDEAVFYTSGKVSNEAAFVYQLFVRAFGTNNLPDCSNMCHESTSVGARRGDRHRQGVGHASRTSTTPTCSSSPARTPAPTTRGC